MRLLLILPEFPPSFGGMQTHALALAEEMQRRNHDVLVVAYQTVSGKDQLECEQCDAELEFPIERVLSRLGHFANIRKLHKLIEQFQPELIYSSTVFYGRAGQRFGVPVVCRSPGNDVLRPWIAWPYRPFANLMSQPWFETGVFRVFKRMDYPRFLHRLCHQHRRELVNKAAQSANSVLANSEFSAGFLRQAGVEGSKIRVVPGGVDVERFSLTKSNLVSSDYSIPKDTFVVLTACRLVHKKGVDFLIQSIPAIQEKIPEVHLVIVGDGPKRAKYRRMISRLGLQNEVTMTGAVPQQDIQNWMAEANVFVLASRIVADGKTDNCDAETMGRVLCEANACGIPVVAANSGGIPSVVAHGENGLLFETDHQAGLVEAIQQIHSNDQLRQELIANGLKRAREEFDWSVIADIHDQEFRRQIEGKHIAEQLPLVSHV